jgi:hypothetical protein
VANQKPGTPIRCIVAPPGPSEPSVNSLPEKEARTVGFKVFRSQQGYVTNDDKDVGFLA